jgi:hypothetical protein
MDPLIFNAGQVEEFNLCLKQAMEVKKQFEERQRIIEMQYSKMKTRKKVSSMQVTLQEERLSSATSAVPVNSNAETSSIETSEEEDEVEDTALSSMHRL